MGGVILGLTLVFLTCFMLFVSYSVTQNTPWKTLKLVVDNRNDLQQYTSRPYLTGTRNNLRQYTNLHSAGNRTGITFTNVSYTLERLQLPPKKFFKLTGDSVRDFVFVTAADEGHFEESKDAIASIQTEAPGYQIHYYDLGLTQNQRNQIEGLCDVHRQWIDLSTYAPHISYLSWKCWKFIVIHDALERIHGAVFWIDASFRAIRPVTEWDDLFELALSNDGIAMPIAPKRRNFAFTDPVLYQYFPTDIKRQKVTDHVCTCAVLLYNTRQLYEQLLHWVYLCSMDPMCCFPPPKEGSKILGEFTKEEMLDDNLYKLHRHDQSMANIVLSNMYDYNASRYSRDSANMKIVRHNTTMYQLSHC